MLRVDNVTISLSKLTTPRLMGTYSQITILSHFAALRSAPVPRVASAGGYTGRYRDMSDTRLVCPVDQ